MNLKIGSRVAVYGASLTTKTYYVGQRGTVKAIGFNTVEVELDGEGDERHGILIHRRQCKKLTKRRKKKVWMLPAKRIGDRDRFTADPHCMDLTSDWIEFVEVRKR